MATLYNAVATILRPLVLSKEAPKVTIDEWSFRLHYRVTALLLFVFSALICMKEYLGDHIKCVHMQEDDGDDPVIPLKVLETYCFITTTFTVRICDFFLECKLTYSNFFRSHLIPKRVCTKWVMNYLRVLEVRGTFQEKMNKSSMHTTSGSHSICSYWG